MSNQIRANRVAVTACEGGYKADFYKTHKHVGTLTSVGTTWQPQEGMNATQAREDFRQWAIGSCAEIEILYDAEDRRTTENKRRAAYKDTTDIGDDVRAMIAGDIWTMCDKSAYADKISDIVIKVDDVIPMEVSPNGKVLADMGVEDGRYLKNGNWAWADINVSVTLISGENIVGVIYLDMQLVSGQLKKFRLTQTAWNELLKGEVGEDAE